VIRRAALILIAGGLVALAAPAAMAASGIHKIKHVVVIMQENRSFDSYFGTYPGADGIPGLAGHPGKVPCVPDPARHRCQRPYHDHQDSSAGGPHMTVDALTDIHGGRMDGFIRSVESAIRTPTGSPATRRSRPPCSCSRCSTGRRVWT